MELIKNRDFTLDSQGRMVLSREYLCARGSCCGSRCTHCPFENRKAEPSGRPVISMVPSLTETLFSAGVRLIGRTRFCIHPAAGVKSIPVFGGTKSLKAGSPGDLSIEPGTLVVLDREENPKDFGDSFRNAGAEVVATHVRDFQSLAKSFEAIADRLNANEPARVQLEIMAIRALKLDAASATLYAKTVEYADANRINQFFSDTSFTPLRSMHQRAVLMRQLANPAVPVFYVIWKNPWMAVGRGTWIATVLQKAWGVDPSRLARGLSDPSLYPKFELGELPKDSVVLLSSEPYPFGARPEELLAAEAEFRAAGASVVALVDGEAFSWFGLRSLRFLEDLAASWA